VFPGTVAATRSTEIIMNRTHVGLLVSLVIVGCDRNSTREAEGVLAGVKGFESVAGKVELEEASSGVRVHLKLENAPPGPKGVHIHEKGDCSDPLLESMGKHFAPHGEPHGLPNTGAQHPGDLGNVVVRDDGRGELLLTTRAGNLKPDDPMTFTNRAVIVHQGEDKGTQPSGDAGKPLACAVIKTD
jgi:Cu-Zn family superoxide dismutase